MWIVWLALPENSGYMHVYLYVIIIDIHTMYVVKSQISRKQSME